jgi:RimJ/RimL family protein N-acetyltransferase
MQLTTWEGERVRLRAVEPEDWETFWAWSHDTEAARGSYQIPFPISRELARRRQEQRATEEPQDHIFRWVIESRAGEFVGTINTHSCEPRNGTFGYGLAVRAEHQRRGYASEAVVLVLRYFFRELRYQKVTVHVYAFNEPSIRLHERLGFTLEGRLRREIYTDGRYWDDLIYGMTIEEFEARHGGPRALQEDAC